MNLIRRSVLITAFLGVVSGPSLATPPYPNFATETGTLSVPIVNINGVHTFNNVELGLDFATGQFALKHFEVVSADFSPMNEIEQGGSAELNDSSADAQTLPAIGANRPVKAEINPAGDQDWYRFEAVAGHTYIVELFDVANNLALVSASYRCNSSSNSGLWLTIYDPSENEVVKQCKPNGVGNTHSHVQFTAGISGTFYLNVAPHAETVSGYYSLRVLPKHDEPNASWDSATFEPNDWLVNKCL